MEKDIWKWVLEQFPEEGIASIQQNLEITIPGFRKVNPQQKNFKLFRQKIIQEALHYKRKEGLFYFFKALSEKNSDLIEFRGKELEEIEKAIEDGQHPSLLFTVLLSSDDEDDHQKAETLFAKFKEEGRLELLESRATESFEETEEGSEEVDVKKLQAELLEEQKKSAMLEKRLKKSELKNEELKAKNLAAASEFDADKKNLKDDIKALTKEIQALKSENNQSKAELAATAAERDVLQKKVEQHSVSSKKKDDEIARLNALLLKLKTSQEREHDHKGETTNTKVIETTLEHQKIKVAIIGDPKNSRVQKYKKFDLNIIEASEMNEEKHHELLRSAEQIWLLTYRTPKGIQKRVKSLIQDKQIHEFANFIDLENFMVKG